MNREKFERSVTKGGFLFSFFETGAEAADYLERSIRDKTVGFGGSVTLRELGLYERLSLHNRVAWHWVIPGGETLAAAREAEIYLSSLNGAAETGELINIDGNGNRLAAALEGHKKVYFVIGANKVAPDYAAALSRARHIAAPKNARRLGAKTPCAREADRCHDCDSPERICRALLVLWEKPRFAGEVELVLVGESLGY